jgi:RHS repeat-associated protein
MGYDSKTRPSTETIAIPGDASYTYTRTYNPTTGLLNTLQYPVSTSAYQLTLQYAYQNGILSQISDATTGTRYWLADTINPRGQLTQETLGNGIVVNHGFDAVTGWLGSIQSGAGGGATIQNNSYLFDEMGNLTQRQDNNQGLTENFYYDNLYRFDHSVLNGATNWQMSYDVTGNVTSWQGPPSGANTMNYTTPQPGCTYYTYSQPHAARSSTQGGGVSSLCYDANGNTLSQSGAETLSWTSFNQANYISGYGSSSQFFYNAQHQRYKQIASYTGSIESTIYIGGLLEKVATSAGTAYRHYIPAGNNTVLYTRLSSGSNATYYITKDHLGGSSKITDSTGALVLSEAFAAWGWRADNWQTYPSQAELTQVANITRHGFTGQEMLDNFYGLVNLNGRIFGAGQIPRMLSADPHVTDPGNTQSFNRYSYVNNNPLTYVDPSGFDEEVSIPRMPVDSDTITGDTSNGSANQSLPEIVVNSSPAGSTITTFNPGGYQFTTPDGDLELLALASNGGKGSPSPTNTSGMPFGTASNPVASPKPAQIQSPQKPAQSQKPTGCSAPFGKFTFQIGFNGNGSFFGVHLSGTYGLAIDGYGHVASYTEIGPGFASSPDASLGAALHFSNGNSIQDLNGLFTNVSVGGGYGPHASGDGFAGYGADGQVVQGGGLTIGAGVGAATSTTVTDTAVTQPFINPNPGCH